MMKKGMAFLAVVVLSSLVLTACGGGAQKADNVSTDRTVPAEFANKSNPVAGSLDAVASGKTIYEMNCASCHGPTGKGDGPAGSALDPHPGDLTLAKQAGDSYLFYRVSEGGMMDPYNSSMPAWKGVLSEEEMWQVVSYIGSLK